jgi:thiosulfate/3-mercaptopyruvate sulfurtransferase
MRTRLFLTVVISLVYLTTIGKTDLISAKEFMALIKSVDNLVIIDAAEESIYKYSHVKDAVNIPHKSLYVEGGVEGIIKSPAELAKIFGSKGISENSKIVIYDDGTQKYSSRVYWILKYLGAKDVKLLHKDMDDWKKVRVPLSRMPAKVTATTFTPTVNKAIYADMVQVRAAKEKAKIIDARTPEEFNGTSEKPVSPGHIPGAININHKDVLTANEAFKSKAELEALAAKYGISANDEVILYCTTSVRGAVLYVAFADILGYTNVKVYDGSLEEWQVSSEVVK